MRTLHTSMKSLFQFLALASLLSTAPLLQAQTAVAGAPATIDYQGQVLDSSGAGLGANSPTNYTMQFRIYDNQTAGAIIWAESQVVTVDKGNFSVRLGSGVPIPAGGNNEGSTRDLRQTFNATERYIGVTVVIPGQPTVEITPRLAFLSSPYAIVAERAKIADTATSAAVASSVTQTTGSSTLGATTVTSFQMNGAGKVMGSNTLEFGTGVQGKQIDSGKISYGAFSGGAALDIIGAGTTIANQKVNIFALGGLTVNGPITTNGAVSASSFAGNGAGLTNVNANLAAGSVDLSKLAANSVDLSKLVDAVKQALCPPGTIVAFGGNTAPPGWVLCDGRALSRTTDSTLFGVIGTSFGSSDGASFNVPDLRGRFTRGRDGGAPGPGRDLDRNSGSRVTSAPGGNSGDNVGSLQLAALQSHNHVFKDAFYAEKFTLPTNPSIPGLTLGSTPGGAGSQGNFDYDNVAFERPGVTTGFDTASNSVVSASETRPVNIAVNYIIKQ